MPDIKQNFFTSARPAPQMCEIAFCNDPKFRAAYGQWLYDNYEDLVAEYKKHGRFLTLDEINNPLD